MNHRDFERDALTISSLTVADLKQAEKEEASQMLISNPRVKLLCKHIFTSNARVKGSDKMQASYQGQIWGTCLRLHGPSLWVTINPCDIHDPILQVFVGEEIDMDKFNNELGPDSLHRASNVARDPYAAAKYFFFIIHTILHTLFGIKATNNQVHSWMGLLGCLTAYFGVVEAQGHRSLHVHMLLWLQDAPNAKEMHHLLGTPEFRHRVCQFI
ncbi:hypothetical protein JVU11DRAFT_1100 [Chiua virens]|nr:hypothetical protein JVU11DRAFT_1100 [Chiua virens]